jgi:hypothetical protein
MKRPGAFLLAAAGAALALTPAVGLTGVAKTQPRVKTVKGDVQSLAMDGAIVAYGVNPGGDCGGKVLFWNVQTNGGGVVSGKRTCEANSTSTGGGITEVAVAAGARRYAWIVNQGGNTESDDYLYTSSLPKPKERYLGMAYRAGDVDAGRLNGDWIEGLVGDGSLVAVSRYTTENADFVKGSLKLIGPKGLKSIATGFDSVTSSSASRGRIAVLASSKKITVFSSDGRLLGAYKTSDANDAELTATQLVVLTDSSLQLFDVKSGKLLHAWPAKRNAFKLDADSGLAAYAIDCDADPCSGAIYVTRLSDGKTVLLAKAKDYVDGLELEPTGLVYAVSGIRSKLVRYSLKQVQAALG